MSVIAGAVGRYVIMPDYVHFFCRPELGAPRLSEFIGAWKSWTSRKIHALGAPWSATAATALWQREFFDHVLRFNDSYDQKMELPFRLSGSRGNGFDSAGMEIRRRD
jgi:REP-associated tyrosine transposase